MLFDKLIDYHFAYHWMWMLASLQSSEIFDWLQQMSERNRSELRDHKQSRLENLLQHKYEYSWCFSYKTGFNQLSKLID